MSYDLQLYLRAAHPITAEDFAGALAELEIRGELAPDFAADGSLSPLCAKLSGLFPHDMRSFLALTELYTAEVTEDLEIPLEAPRRFLWWKKKAPAITVPAGWTSYLFSCGMDSLEVPFALLLCRLLAGEDGILVDPQEGEVYRGEEIAAYAEAAFAEVQDTPADRLLLHEFDEWI